MKKNTLLNNKGFSLVELIIVIAIMAILIGILAPNLLRYVERTNISSDTQLAETLRTAITTAIMDPNITGAITTGTLGDSNPGANDMANDIAQTLGIPGWTNGTSTGADIVTFLNGELRSRTNGVPTWIVTITPGSSAITVQITGTNRFGNAAEAGGTAHAENIIVPTP